MTKFVDLYGHLDETLVFTANVSNPSNNMVFNCAFALEWTTDNITTISSANTASFTSNTTKVRVSYTPTLTKGFKDANHVYQLQGVDTSNNITVVQEGRLFLEHSLFD